MSKDDLKCGSVFDISKWFLHKSSESHACCSMYFAQQKISSPIASNSMGKWKHMLWLAENNEFGPWSSIDCYLFSGYTEFPTHTCGLRIAGAEAMHQVLHITYIWQLHHGGNDIVTIEKGYIVSLHSPHTWGCCASLQDRADAIGSNPGGNNGSKLVRPHNVLLARSRSESESKFDRQFQHVSSH